EVGLGQGDFALGQRVDGNGHGGIEGAGADGDDAAGALDDAAVGADLARTRLRVLNPHRDEQLGGAVEDRDRRSADAGGGDEAVVIDDQDTVVTDDVVGAGRGGGEVEAVARQGDLKPLRGAVDERNGPGVAVQARVVQRSP